MLSTFIGQIAGLFDKRFLFRVWFPTFLFGAAGVMVAALAKGLQPAVETWSELPALTQAWFSAGGLIVVTFVAYVCDNLMDGMVRLYEGYWPGWASWPRGMCLWVQRRRWQHVSERMDRLDISQQRTEYDRLYASFYHTFPRGEALLMPTRLGNVLRAAEEYSKLAYNLDAPTVWPRLVQYLPAGFQSRLAQSSIPLTTMLFSATLSFLFAVVGGVVLFVASDKWWLFVAAAGGGLALSAGCYESAVQRAVEYGMLIRTAFDLYRHELLKALGVPLPLSPQDERKVWAKLVGWWYQLEIPTAEEGKKAWYDVGKKATPDKPQPKRDEHVVYLKLGAPPKEERK